MKIKSILKYFVLLPASLYVVIFIFISFDLNNTMGILTKDVLAYIDAFENETEKDNFVDGQLSESILKALKNMPIAN